MERDRGFNTFFWGLAAGINMMNLLHLVIDPSDHDKKEAVANVQMYNEQLQDELNNSHRQIEHLRLDDSKEQFSFEMMSETGEKLVCHGEYEVNQETAKAVGDLACTSTQKISK